MPDEKNKVKFGLSNVHYAKITSWGEDGNTPNYAAPVRIPGAVSMSLDANGEQENFYADNIVYYVVNNNSGYEGDLEIALTPDSFRTDILGETLDEKNVMVERSDAEIAQFAILFEINGDKKHMRYCFYCCSASRPAISSSTLPRLYRLKFRQDIYNDFHESWGKNAKRKFFMIIQELKKAKRLLKHCKLYKK